MESNFSLDKIKTISPLEAKAYVSKYFVPLTNGNHAMLINDKYVIQEDKVIKSTYFKRMPKELSTFYFQEHTGIKEVKYKINAPTFFDNYLNLCPKMKHEYKSYNEFSDEIKTKVDIMTSYIKEVLCANRDDVYNFIMKWLANMIKGNKNTSCLYFRGPQGVGKSTLAVFLREYVIGSNLSLETGSEPIKSNFNSILAGKLMVVLEELENFSINEWQVVSTRLKRYITSNTITIESKNVNSYESENINNYIIVSNNDAIKDDEGRRYFIADTQTHREGDVKFWDNLYSNCFNDTTGYAFYCLLMEIDTDKFNPQNFPMTMNKADSFAKRMDHVYLFIKEKYILKNRDLLTTLSDFYSEFLAFSLAKGHKACSKIDFNKKLKDIQINHYKSNTCLKFNMTHDKLLEIAEKRHWMHESDEYEAKSKNIFVKDDSDTEDDYDFGIANKDESVNIMKNFKLEINKLKIENELQSFELSRYKLKDKMHDLQLKSSFLKHNKVVLRIYEKIHKDKEITRKNLFVEEDQEDNDDDTDVEDVDFDTNCDFSKATNFFE